MKELSNTASNFKESVFTTISQLARENDAINLSQGMPDFDGPDWVKQYAIDAISSGKNQQAPAHGTLELRESISSKYSRLSSLSYDPNTDITVTAGATEALFSTILALVNPGDEVVIIEPFFDTYIPAIQMAGGIPKIATLLPDSFTLDFEELEKVFSSKTKAIIINSPHNPSGKVLSLEEIEKLSEIILKYDTYVISDEVYEFLTYDKCKHISPASLPSLFDRTIVISSTGKTFGFTGWRIGWACAPQNLTSKIKLVHQNNTFSAPHPFQDAMAKSLYKLEDYVIDFNRSYQSKRDLLFNGLKDSIFEPILPDSTYFILAKVPIKGMKDTDFVKKLIKEHGIAIIPCSPFYAKEINYEYVRFCFAKKNETIVKAIETIKRIKL